jgi:hypothetical protein
MMRYFEEDDGRSGARDGVSAISWVMWGLSGEQKYKNNKYSHFHDSGSMG